MKAGRDPFDESLPEWGIQTRVFNSEAFVVCEGDFTAPGRIAALVRSAAAASGMGCRSLLLDLSRVDAADTKMVACLVMALRLCRKRTVNLTIHISPIVAEWLRCCRVERVLARYARVVGLEE